MAKKTDPRKRTIADDPLQDVNTDLFTEPETDNRTTQINGIDSPFVDDGQVKQWIVDEKFMNDFVKEVNRRERLKKEAEKEYQRQTFIISKKLLQKLRDYCYDHRITQRDALELALKNLLGEESDNE